MQPLSPLRLLKCLLFAFLAWVSIADILLRAKVMAFTPDEIFNLDVVISFLTTGDYTTQHLGGFPFDPAISGGLLVTWPHGLVFLLGGSLFAARALSGLLQLASVGGLAFAFFRSRGIGRLDCAVLAIGIWVGLLRILSHELRMVNAGDLWAFILLLSGTLLLSRSPSIAAFFWGLSTWLGKTIYLPFAAALLVASLIVNGRAGGTRIFSPAVARSCVRIAASFAAPMVIWMAVIWLRYDLRTLIGWCSSRVSFVFKHAIGHDLGLAALPGLEGWSFDPRWADSSPFLSLGLDVTLPSLIPLALGPVTFAVLAGLSLLGTVRISSERWPYLTAAAVAVIAFTIWFLAFDPTQWGRHLMPAVYGSVALAVYCLTTIWQQLRPWPKPISAIALIAYLAVVSVAVTHARAYAGEVSWKGSYSKTCRGLDVLVLPCFQSAADTNVSGLIDELCGLPGGGFDENCVRDRRTELLSRSVGLATKAPGDPQAVQTCGYMTLFVQRWAYDDEADFIADLARLVCPSENALLLDYFETSALDVNEILRRCRAY